ncbi:conserved hypothetical protein [Leishmania major strain Friedlin]|uniref:Uncharacterized protein n=1 Tax=Leishmania major TaxID=5664 RepID=Q4Q3B7_LEIMA|nr:conserved hypothetical protein [Leishmania major strain Friedlin]CAG9581887.1 hypothetical_protein_-_conserved [Leishmania major strain Friedlin]CAJ07795.1 conserved hypothetical protein [Leishmania major strain Friedlin]|eukprot:XP_001686181.1 conserved hypothetical protein [Leishmania major strain Friedlin]
MMPPLVRIADAEPTSSRSSCPASYGAREDIGDGGKAVISGAVSPALARELSLLSNDDLIQRIHRFSRSNFVPAQRPLLYAHLKEFMKPQRLAYASTKTVQDHLQVANAADMHETCIELYHAAREHMSAAALMLRTPCAPLTNGSATGVGQPDAGGHVGLSTASGSGTNLAADGAVLVSAFVVDSAYATQRTSELTRLASYCVTQLLAPLHAEGHDATTGDASPATPKVLRSLAVRTPREVATELSLVRCLWRALCLAEYYKCAEATSTQAVKGCKEQALADALAILDACRQVASVRREAAVAVLAAVANGHSSSSTTTPALSERQSSELLAEALNFVRYASLDDDGEFAFYQFCKEEGILWSPQPLSWSVRRETSDAASSLSSAAGVGRANTFAHSEDEVQVFYAALIDTCAAGRLVPEALLYFTEARRLLGCPPLVDGEDIGAETVLLLGAEGGRGPRVSSVAAATTLKTSLEAVDAVPRALPPAASAATAESSDPGMSAPLSPLSHPATVSSGAHGGKLGFSTATAGFALTELLLHRLLSVLQAAKKNHHVVRLARALIAAGAVSQIKAHMWTVLLISAGAVRAADVVLAVYGYALERLASPAGSEGSSGRGYTTAEVCTLEYLLQTSLNALSKCQLPRYEQDYLQPARDAQVLHCTDEFYYSCLLQEAHNSMCPAQRAAEVLARMEEAKVPMTTPIVSRLLKLYLRVEAPEFIRVYRHAVDDLGLPLRSVWADQLLLWADRRRYFLSADDREYVVQQLLRSRRVATVADLQPLLGGLRTHFALLYYDHTHAAREQFLRDGSVPVEQPTVTDSRAHFLMTRPMSVQRGVMARAGTSWVCNGVGGEELVEEETRRHGILPRMLGDAPRRTLHAGIAELSETPLLFPIADGTAGAGDSERLHDRALRVYLADVLDGLQRSSNWVI